jgi:lipoyl(octanoyl) transferase
MPPAATQPDIAFRRADDKPVSWVTSAGLTDYPAAVAAMEARVSAIIEGEADEMVWLLEHPPLYSAGVSARSADLLTPGRFPVFHSGRGGQFTYHGPGQRIAYVMLDLRRRRRDTHAFVSALEGWIIAALKDAGVASWTVPGRVGVWTAPAAGLGGDEKIAAIGVRLRKWVSFHGVSVNVSPDLEHFTGIVPCGIADAVVTSLAELGSPVGFERFDRTLERAFTGIFGRVDHRPDTLIPHPPLG